jgi:NTP pyrophosphatase (non-canonical NTP hydrolase)
VTKLFMVLSVAGHVGGTWGPLPYGLSECLNRAQEEMAELAEAIEKHKELPPDVLDSVKTWRLECVARSERPELGDKWK